MQVETTGGRLRLVRELLGLSQGELARRLGVSGATVSRWESDGTELGSNEVRRVAAAIGVTPSVFYLEDEWQELASALGTVQRILNAARRNGTHDNPVPASNDPNPASAHVAKTGPLASDNFCIRDTKPLLIRKPRALALTH